MSGPDAARHRLAQVPFFASEVPAGFLAPGRGNGSTLSELNGVGSIKPRRAVSTGLDWSVVTEMHHRVLPRLATDLSLSLEDQVVRSEPILVEVVNEFAGLSLQAGQAWDSTLQAAYLKALTDRQWGNGRLQPLLDIPDAENIDINGCDSVRVHYNDGRVEHWGEPVAESDEELMMQLKQIGEHAVPPRPFDSLHPEMTVSLGGTHRLHAVHNDVALRPSVSIRQHLHKEITLLGLSEMGMMPLEVAQYLDCAVKANKTLVVGGTVGSGKTTLLRALTDAIPLHHRFATLETDMELFAHQVPGRDNCLVLFARSSNGEPDPTGRTGEVTVADQIPWVLRQNIRRIIVGEVRGVEASAMFQAMQVGSGAMCTIHSHSAAQTANRLADRVVEGKIYDLAAAKREITENVHLLVQIGVADGLTNKAVVDGPRRWIQEVVEITRGDDGTPAFHTVYRSRHGESGQLQGSSYFANELAAYRAPLSLVVAGRREEGRG